MNVSSVRLSIPADAIFIDLARLNLYGIANKMGFSYEEIEDMKVAVSEACNNVVIHAYEDQAAGTIDIEFEITDAYLRIRVKDEGKSFVYKPDQRQVSMYEKSLQDISIGGLGIYMMQALMDEVEVINQSGTEVVLTKLLNRAKGENDHELESFSEAKRGY